ncbi:hypothetical protein KGF56_000350 [Candida oxycetoniae]|uniref:Gag1-like clamp domain-containing protein n=1 Tax=Candida oxycetoniae TaxID=497107 RepID=A0AAI9X0A3_9ASCO|nr:uncharacterized protein KGF56_000350 [Candida oxycetoniae]KAI3406745.2 hypothetical protein KGF56_000350 [Candida oxycetoniae]
MNSEVRSLNADLIHNHDLHPEHPTSKLKRSAFTKLRKAQSTSKLRITQITQNTQNTLDTQEQQNHLHFYLHHTHHHHHPHNHRHQLIPLKKKKTSDTQRIALPSPSPSSSTPPGNYNNTTQPTTSEPVTSTSTTVTSSTYSGKSKNKDKKRNRSRKKSLQSLSTVCPPSSTGTASAISTSVSASASTESGSSFFKKISSEWNSLLRRLKSISEEVFNPEDIVDNLFIETDSDDHTSLDRLLRSSRGYNSTEEKFLQDYKRFKSLDQMYAHYNDNNGGGINEVSTTTIAATSNNNNNNNNSSTLINNYDVGSSTTVVSDPLSYKIRTTLQDVIRNQSTSTTAINLYQYQNIDEFNSDEEEEGGSEVEGSMPLDDNADTATSTITNEIVYNDIDFILLRKEFEAMVSSTNPKSANTNTNTNTSDSDVNSRLTFAKTQPSQVIAPNINIGSTLWDYRRKKWLQCTNNPRKIRERINRNSISHIPEESYAKIYNNLIEKNKCLKTDKHLNLSDLISVINAGWIAEEKWERAARGIA